MGRCKRKVRVMEEKMNASKWNLEIDLLELTIQVEAEEKKKPRTCYKYLCYGNYRRCWCH